MKELLFICTGNYYRSRFAEAWFNFRIQGRLDGWRAISRGLDIGWAPPGMSADTRDAIKRFSIPEECYTHQKTALTEACLKNAELVYALKETEHKPMIMRQFPQWESKVHYWEIHDLDVAGPEVTIPEICLKVDQLISSLEID